MSYVDGFLLAIPKKNLKAYKAMSNIGGKVWREYGALDYRECMGDDLVFKGMNSFLKLLKCKKSEVPIFAYILYKSKADRNKINKKVMKDPRLHMDMKKMPFDMKRMWMGGFESIVEV